MPKLMKYSWSQLLLLCNKFFFLEINGFHGSMLPLRSTKWKKDHTPKISSYAYQLDQFSSGQCGFISRHNGRKNGREKINCGSLNKPCERKNPITKVKSDLFDKKRHLQKYSRFGLSHHGTGCMYSTRLYHTILIFLCDVVFW